MSNTQTISRYPLQWPAGWPRTPSYRHKSGMFRGGSSRSRLTVAAAMERVRDELGRMGVRDDDLVVSTNLPLRLDGFPRSDQSEPTDRGAAVYWRAKNATRCMAIDNYERVADNLAAIAATLSAMRAIERHGGAEILERAFTGFAALQGPEVGRPWHEVLNCAAHASTEAVSESYKRLRSLHHPDRATGNAERFAEVQRAWNTFCAERGIAP